MNTFKIYKISFNHRLRQNIVNNMEKLLKLPKYKYVYKIGSTTEAVAPEYDNSIV